MDPDEAKAKHAAIYEELGQKIRVFKIQTASELSTTSNLQKEEELNDDFYEFTAEDYYRTVSTKIKDQFLKTRKFREAEAAARRAKFTKVVMRVKFPDQHVLEATFHPSDKIQVLIDLLVKAVARPDISFYLYTTPPKQRIKDMSVDFYTAGFVPGAIVYFSYDLSQGGSEEEISAPFLRDDVISLETAGKTSEFNPEPPKESEVIEVKNPLITASTETLQSKSTEKKPAKPKWFKRMKTAAH